MGPTASGKTSVAVALKQRHVELEIVSVDSALVYRGMDIGTAKPGLEVLKIAPHRLIDIRDPAECYSVADFFYDANREIECIVKSGHVPLLVGGTMLYFYVLLKGLFSLPKANKKIRDDLMSKVTTEGWVNIYAQLRHIDPIAARRIHINDHKRIIRALEIFFISGKTLTELQQVINRKLQYYRIFQFALVPSNKEILNKRIEQRFYHMLNSGFENEVIKLYARSDLHQEEIKPSISCVGYRQMWEYLSGNIEYNDMVFRSICATRQFAKQQLTWLRRWPNLNWLNSDRLSVVVDNILKILTKTI